MDPKVAYWTWALANMAAAVACAAAGIVRVRRGDVGAHRRLMLAAAGLVVLFLASYPFKLGLLGREALETWQASHVVVLRVHEACVALMTLCGGAALAIALRDGFPLEAPSAAGARRIALHRRAGRTAVVAGGLGLLLAGFVLFGMYARL